MRYISRLMKSVGLTDYLGQKEGEEWVNKYLSEISAKTPHSLGLRAPGS